MKVRLRILAVLASSFIVVGCGSLNRADSQRMLDARAAYDGGPGSLGDNVSVKEAGVEGFRNSPVPVRTRPKVAPIWIFPHETATRDYFWGGWISVVVESDQWVMSKPQLVPKAPGFELTPYKAPPPPPPLMPQQKK